MVTSKLRRPVLGSVRFAKILGTKGMGWLNAFQFLVGSVMDEAHASSLTKLTQFQAIQEDCKNVKFARIYIDEIVARNEILVMLKLQISVDKTLRLVEEPIEIGDYKGKSKILLEVLVKDGYEGFLVDGCFFSFGAVMLLCVPLCGQSKLLAVRYLVKVSWSSKYNFELAWLWEDYVIDKWLRLSMVSSFGVKGIGIALSIQWSHDLVEGTPAPLGLLWIGGERHEDVKFAIHGLCIDDPLVINARRRADSFVVFRSSRELLVVEKHRQSPSLSASIQHLNPCVMHHSRPQSLRSLQPIRYSASSYECGLMGFSRFEITLVEKEEDRMAKSSGYTSGMSSDDWFTSFIVFLSDLSPLFLAGYLRQKDPLGILLQCTS
ncbi:hypothetical protein Tco_0087975 [Tanacetum coccineum]